MRLVQRMNDTGVQKRKNYMDLSDQGTCIEGVTTGLWVFRKKTRDICMFPVGREEVMLETLAKNGRITFGL